MVGWGTIDAVRKGVVPIRMRGPRRLPHHHCVGQRRRRLRGLQHAERHQRAILAAWLGRAARHVGRHRVCRHRHPVVHARHRYGRRHRRGRDRRHHWPPRETKAHADSQQEMNDPAQIHELLSHQCPGEERPLAVAESTASCGPRKKRRQYRQQKPRFASAPLIDFPGSIVSIQASFGPPAWGFR